jgi:AraC-like DNA-binding protein
MLTLHTLTRLCRARDELRETLTFPLSIHDVAQTAQMLPYHFIRRFEAVFGETPHQFRTWARLERAKHLRASPLMPGRSESPRSAIPAAT